MADKDFKVKTGIDLPTPLPIIEGGTGQTSANNALNALLPTQTSAANYFLKTDGTNTSWASAASADSPTFTGTVTLPSTTSIGTVTSTEIGYVDGVTSSIQTQLDAKSNITKTLSEKTADYTLASADSGNIIEFNSASDLNLTLPTYSNVPLTYGSNFKISNKGSGKVNILNQSGTNPLTSITTTGLGSTYSIAYGNGYYVTQSGISFYKSSNGTSFSQISSVGSISASSLNHSRAIYANGLFVILGGTALYTSTDTTTWTSRLSYTSGNAIAIEYANNKFMVVGANGFIAQSTDGITWTSSTGNASLTTQTLYDVTYMSSTSTWYAYTTSSPYIIKSTDDGSTWTQVSVTGLGSAGKSIATNGNILVIAGTLSTFYTSTDGASWTSRSLPNGFNGNYASGTGKVTYDGTVFFISALRSTPTTEIGVLTSSDGITWSRQSYISGTSVIYGAALGPNNSYLFGGTSNTLYTAGTVVTDYKAIPQGIYLPPNGVIDIYNYAQNRYVINGNLGNNISVSSNITMVSGMQYFVDTSAARTLTLPASPSLGDQILVFDASGTAATYNITIARNSNLINANAGNLIIDTNGAAVSLTYTGATYGWKVG